MKTKKILVTIMLLISIISIFQIKANAALEFPSFSKMKSDAEAFLKKGGGSKISVGDMGKVFKPMAQLMLGIGVFVLVGVTIVMGIKYVFASPEEAAKLKQQLVGLVVSAVVIFGAVGIWTLAYNVFESVF